MLATIRCASLLTLLLAIVPIARAQSSEPAARSGNGQGQLALIDAVSVGAATTGYFTGRAGAGSVSGIMWTVGGVGYFLGGPLVHLNNQEYALAGVSAAVRLVFPIIGAAIGGNMTTCAPEQGLCGLEEAAQGFAIGAATAVIFDNALTALAKASEKMPPPSARPPRAAPITMRPLPSLMATPNVAMFGVGGRF